MNLSIVIPAYQESAKISHDIRAASNFLISNNLHGEIIVVDDGSSDATASTASATPTPDPIKLTVISSTPNRGKGFAVRAGILRADPSADFITFADSGTCVPFAEAMIGIEMIRRGDCDIAHASRRISGCHILRPQTRFRRFCSRAFRTIVRTWLHVPHYLTDTQCGFKVYRADVAREIYAQCITDGFTFDIEVIMRATRCGYKIKEFPIDWTCDCDSRITLTHTSLKVIRELLRIRRTLKNHTQPTPPAAG
jgi:dolichyl-phosphate beta-glucosyltransferase